MKAKDHEQSFYIPVDATSGKISNDPKMLRLAFHATRGNGRIDYASKPPFSRLLREPLAKEFGGLPHRGLEIFLSPEDPDYPVLESWVRTEIESNPAKTPDSTPEFAHFEKEIQPLLVRKGCFLSSCHGPDAFNDLKLQPPLPVYGGEDVRSGFSRSMTAANRSAVLGNVSRFLNLGGDLRFSRLIAKNLPIAAGGIHQRGGNIQFFSSYEDRDVQKLLEWAKIERSALVKKLRSENESIKDADLGALQGVVFIRGPRHAPRKFFQSDPFWPGSDIYFRNLKDGASEINLTASLHPNAKVEIQSVDVRYDGRTIVFSMRTEENKPFRIYEAKLKKDLSGLENFRQLSFGQERLSDGTLVHHLDPIYTPGPGDDEGYELDKVSIAYASNAAGAYSESEMYGILGEADSGGGRVVVDAQRPERAGTFDGYRVFFVGGPGKGQWRKIVKHESNVSTEGGSRLVLDRPVDFPVDRRTVYMIEKKSPEKLSSFDIWRFVPDVGRDSRETFEKSNRRITYTDAQDRRPTMRTTGEVMFTSVRNIGFQDGKPVFNGAIFRVMAGGFDYHIHGGNRSGYPLYFDSRELPNGLEIRLAGDPRNFWGGGELILVDHGLGVNVEPENPMDDVPFTFDPKDPYSRDLSFASTPRFIPVQVPVFPETGKEGVRHTGVSRGGVFRDPFPLPDGRILVAYAKGSVDHLSKDADPDFDLYFLRFPGAPQAEDGKAAGPVEMEKVPGVSTQESEYSPRPIIVRLKEKGRTQQKFTPDATAAGTKDEFGVLKAPQAMSGEIECYDYPLLQSFLTNFAPSGARNFKLAWNLNPSGENTPEDERFRFVRILMQMPPSKDDVRRVDSGNGDPFATPVSNGVHQRKRIVAEVPIEEDGSFYVEVPTNASLIMQGLNRHKMAMHSMNRWFYLQPGEKLTFSIPRSIFPLRCAGCHGALTGQPVDGVGEPDIATASSRVMANWDPTTKAKRLSYGKQTRPDSGLSVDYRRDVQPIFDSKCVSCHGPKASAAGLRLDGTPTRHYSVSYEQLHRLRDPSSGNHADKKYINEREGLSSSSPLIHKLKGWKGFKTPHPQKDPLSEDELLTLIRWIDLGATYQGGRQ